MDFLKDKAKEECDKKGERSTNRESKKPGKGNFFKHPYIKRCLAAGDAGPHD